MRMIHYVCRGGCDAVSVKETKCALEGCPQFGQSFEECSCEAKEHDRFYEVETEIPERPR